LWDVFLDRSIGRKWPRFRKSYLLPCSGHVSPSGASCQIHMWISRVLRYSRCYSGGGCWGTDSRTDSWQLGLAKYCQQAWRIGRLNWFRRQQARYQEVSAGSVVLAFFCVAEPYDYQNSAGPNSNPSTSRPSAVRGPPVDKHLLQFLEIERFLFNP
jgi:hypothetical protein